MSENLEIVTKDRDSWRDKAKLRGDQLCMLRDWMMRNSDQWKAFTDEYPYVLENWFDSLGRPK